MCALEPVRVTADRACPCNCNNLSPVGKLQTDYGLVPMYVDGSSIKLYINCCFFIIVVHKLILCHTNAFTEH